MMKIKAGVQALRRREKGGFTLVELIVVLVILAVLAAFMIPSMIGYIDEARKQQLIVQTRQAVMAAQTLFDEAYGAGLSGSIAKKQTDVLSISLGDGKIGDKIYELAELDSTDGAISNVTTDHTGKILTLTWQVDPDQDGDKCVYNAANKNEPYTVTLGEKTDGG